MKGKVIYVGGQEASTEVVVQDEDGKIRIFEVYHRFASTSAVKSVLANKTVDIDQDTHSLTDFTIITSSTETGEKK